MMKLRIRIQFLRLRLLHKGYVSSIIIVARPIAKFNSRKGMTLRGLRPKATASTIICPETLVFFPLFQAVPGRLE